MYPTKPTTIICSVRVSACHEWYWRRHSYRRSFDDSACLDDLLLVQLRARTVEVADNGGHAGLVAHGGGQVALLLGVVLRKAVCEPFSSANAQFLHIMLAAANKNAVSLCTS